MTIGSKPFSRLRIEEKFGCTYSEYLELRDRPDKPIAAFVDHRCNAKVRGVAWELSLTQWWSVWQQSGHWEARGRGCLFYCMSRKGDVGPYSVENVFIAKFRENSSIHPNKKSDLPMGVSKPSNGSRGYQARRRIKGKMVHLGTYASADLASASYLASIQSEENRA